MHHLRTTLAAAASIAALGLAGCSSSGSTETPSTPPETTGSAPTSEANAGLEIDNPKNLAAVKNPCELLKPEQAQQLGLSNSSKPGTKTEWGEPSCDWGTGEKVVTFEKDTTQNQNISKIMKREGNTEPDGQVDGYPVVETLNGSFNCGIYVGLAETQNVSVLATVPSDGGQDACEFAKKAAGMAISNLPPAT